MVAQGKAKHSREWTRVKRRETSQRQCQAAMLRSKTILPYQLMYFRAWSGLD